MKRPKSIDTNGTVCVACGVGHMTLYNGTLGAAQGDFRVVCREEGCTYGERTDREGNGYTNHTHIVLAKSALKAHQSDVDGLHDAQIEQHPCTDVVGS